MPARLLMVENRREGDQTPFRVWLACGCPFEFSLPWPEAPTLDDEYPCPTHGCQVADQVLRLPQVA